MRLIIAFLLMVLAVWDLFSFHPWVAIIPAFAAGFLTASHFYAKVRV